MIVVVMAGGIAFLPVVSLHPEATPRDAAALSPDKPALGESDRKGGKGFLKNLLGHPEVAQCRNGHVAADAGERVDVEEFHGQEARCGDDFERVSKPARQGNHARKFLRLGSTSPGRGKKISSTCRQQG
jgi:hypothetical protein